MEDPASRERWRQVQRLFAEVVGLEPERREARLERACRDDPALREAVQILLDQHMGGDGVASDHEPEGLPAPSKRGIGPMPASEDDPQGELINGRYRLLSELGRGAMGVVYKAEDTKLRCFVTLKFLHAHLAADREARDRFIDEARAASDLHHPNICQVKDHDETEDGRLFLVMAYYDGGETLEKTIKKGPLPVEQAVDIARQIAAGLAAAHQPTELRPNGIIHRDIKPSNILVTDKGTRAIILDFGIAKMTDSGLTGTGTVLGTLAYMSPEHLHGQVDRGTDLWALGVVLYEMLAGEQPFQADYGGALQNVILNNDLPSLAKHRKRIPRALREVVNRCLEKEPEVRYQSAEEIEAELKQIEERSNLDWIVRAARRVFKRMRAAVHRRRKSLAIFALGAPVLALLLLLSPARTEIAEWLDGAPDVRHLAVLPLTSPADASIGEGLTLTLTSLLTQLGAHAERPITVVPASEMREIETAEGARDRFDVDVVVSGDFRQDGDEAHLTLNLINAHTLHQLDTEQITEPASRLPVLQQRALAVLAGMLGVPLSDEREAMLTAGGTADAEAYGFYLKGKAALEHFDQPESVDMAIELFQWALADDSLYALAHAGLGEAYVRKYQATQGVEWVHLAEKHSHRALELAERLAEVHVTMGLLHNFTGNHEAALRELSIALAIDSTDATAHHLLAVAFRDLQRVEEAEASFRRAIALSPQNWRPYNDLGTFYFRTGRLDEAASQFLRVIELAPNQVVGYENLGVNLLYQEDYDEAQRFLEQAIEIRPTYRAYANLGTVYAEQEWFAEGVGAYERALQIKAGNYLVWSGLGDALRQLGRDPEADSVYRHAAALVEAKLTVSPSSPELLSDLATYYIALGQRTRALEVLERVPINISSDAYLAHRVALLYEQLGQREQALRWVREALDRGLPPTVLETDPDLQGLRQDTRLLKLLSP